MHSVILHFTYCLTATYIRFRSRIYAFFSYHWALPVQLHGDAPAADAHSYHLEPDTCWDLHHLIPNPVGHPSAHHQLKLLLHLVPMVRMVHPSLPGHHQYSLDRPSLPGHLEVLREHHVGFDNYCLNLPAQTVNLSAKMFIIIMHEIQGQGVSKKKWTSVICFIMVTAMTCFKRSVTEWNDLSNCPFWIGCPSPDRSDIIIIIADRYRNRQAAQT